MTIKEINNKYTSSNVMWGRVKDQVLGSELDSSTIVITNSPKLDIQSDDLIELQNENGDYEFWLVADKNEEYLTFKSPFKYQYTINLMSVTKLFEFCFLPNLTITNIGQNRSVYSYISRAVNQYFKNNYGLIPTIAANLTTKTQNVIAKEYTFSEPTLREYLDWLLSLVGAITQLKVIKSGNGYYFQVDCLDLSGNDTLIDTSYITEIVSGQDSNSYISRILHTSDEIVSEQTITEYLRESTTEPIFNTDTAMLQLNRKAYDLKSVKILHIQFAAKFIEEATVDGSSTKTTRYDSSEDSSVPDYIDVDLADLIVTNEEYSTLSIPNPSEYRDGNITNIETYYAVTPNKYKTNTLTWNRGSNEITNMHYMQNWSLLWSDFNSGTSIENAILRKIFEWFRETYPNKGYSFYKISDWPDGRISLKVQFSSTIFYIYHWEIEINYDYDVDQFRVEYQPYFSPKIVEASDRRNAIYSLDTNTNVKTDILTHLDRSKEKLGQLACDYKIMTGISVVDVENNDYAPKIQLGQVWYDDDKKYILTKLETSIYNNHIQYKGTLAFNFSNTIIDTSLNREKRYFAYANTNIVERKENVVKTWKVSLSTLSHSALPMIPADYCRIGFNVNNSLGYYLLPVVPIYNDRMITFELSTMDNISITSIKGDSITGGYQNMVLKYVDENGEFNYYSISLGMLNAESTTQVVGKTPIEWASTFDISECSEEEYDAESGEYETIDRSSNLMIASLPFISEDILKDNREQFSLNVQYILKVENNIQNSDSVITFDLEKYLKAFDYNIVGLFTWHLDIENEDNPLLTSGQITSPQITIEGETIPPLFGTNFMTLYQNAGGTHYNDDNITLRITHNHLGEVARITNYKGGYIISSYEDFI